MRGVVYNTANPPSDPFFQLTNEDIISLMNQAVGLPIRVEHETHDVGRVVSASFNGVDAVVEWEFSENASGWTAEKLVELRRDRRAPIRASAALDALHAIPPRRMLHAVRGTCANTDTASGSGSAVTSKLLRSSRSGSRVRRHFVACMTQGGN
jgi:hypothetical protein